MIPPNYGGIFFIKDGGIGMTDSAVRRYFVIQRELSPNPAHCPQIMKRSADPIHSDDAVERCDLFGSFIGNFLIRIDYCCGILTL